jgi:hypothetical protein
MIFYVFFNLIVMVHCVYVLFVVFGGFLVIKWRNLGWIHVPAFLWAAFIECAGWLCPLTPLENWLRARGGVETYQTGFIEHYILHLLYPLELTRSLQIFLGLFVLTINLGIYGWMLWRTPARNA